MSRPISRNQGWKRKFSCTASTTPAASASATVSRASASERVKAFWQIAGMPSEAASATRSRWLAGGVAMSTRSGRSRAIISAGSS